MKYIIDHQYGDDKRNINTICGGRVGQRWRQKEREKEKEKERGTGDNISVN